MEKLIDADDVISLLANHHFDDSKENTDLLIHNLCKEVKSVPTAYDVDKVVEQLEKRIQTHERCIEYEKKNGTITEEFQQRKAVEVLKEAIEIVKGGGVDAKTDS